MDSKKGIFRFKWLFLNIFLISDITIRMTNGCTLIRDEDGKPVDLNGVQPIIDGEKQLYDNNAVEVIYSYTAQDITSITKDLKAITIPSGGVLRGQYYTKCESTLNANGTKIFSAKDYPDSRYFDFNFEDNNLEISLTKDFSSWEIDQDETFSTTLDIFLEIQCTKTVILNIRAQIRHFTNNYEPIFSASTYNILIPVPLPKNFVITGDCGVESIDVTDYDYHNSYMSQLKATIQDSTGEFTISADKSVGKTWSIILETTDTLRIEEPLSFVIVVEDSPPSGRRKSSARKTAETTITITPDIEQSTPISPVFNEPIFIMEVTDGSKISPITATIIEGSVGVTEVYLEVPANSNGQSLADFFRADISGSQVTVTSIKPLTDDVLENNFGIMILVATVDGAVRKGRTVIHVTLPGNSATPPTTGTTEACIYTTVTAETCTPCPTETTTQITDPTPCPTETTEVTTCPTVECPTEITTECPPCTCAPCSTEETTVSSTGTTECPPCTTETVPECTTVTIPECTTVTVPECTTECPPCPCEDNTTSSTGTTECPPCTTVSVPESTTECPSHPCEDTTTSSTGATECPTECPPCTTVTVPDFTTECPPCTTVSVPESTTECSPCSCEGTSTSSTGTPEATEDPSSTTTEDSSGTTTTEDSSGTTTEESSSTTTTEDSSSTTTTTTDGSSGTTTEGSKGTTTEGSSGTTTEGSTGTTTEGSSGTTTEGSSGTTTEGSSGTTTEGSSGTTTEGSSGTTTTEDSTGTTLSTPCPTMDITTCPTIDCSTTSLTECPPCTTERTTSTAGSPGQCTPCPEIPSTCAPCGGVTVPPESKWIHFREEEVTAYVYPNVIGPIKTMTADCSDGCQLKYGIEIDPQNPLNDKLFINSTTGIISLTKGTEDGGIFSVTAEATTEEITPARAKVQLFVQTLIPCEDGPPQWKNSLTVKSLLEHSNIPLSMEQCGFRDECTCKLTSTKPTQAADFFSYGKELTLIKEIDREDTTLFPDQSNTNIILYLENSCPNSFNSTSKSWNSRSRSVIGDIGSIPYGTSKTVIVIQIEDKNDHRPSFNIPSPLTIGYPDAEIAKQVLPPHVIQVQAIDIDEGENAIITYELESSDEFTVHADTGVIYPNEGGFEYKDTNFKVYARDSEGPGESLSVQVKILNRDNLIVIIKSGSLLEDMATVLLDISSITNYKVKSLSAMVIANSDSTEDRKIDNTKHTRDSKTALLRMVVYGLDEEDKPVHSSVLKEKLEDKYDDITAVTWTSIYNDNNNGEDGDAGMLAAVITLAVILSLVLSSAGIGFVLYIRSKRNRNAEDKLNILSNSSNSSISSSVENGTPALTEDKTNPLANVQFSNTTETIEPTPPTSPALPRVSVTGTKAEQASEFNTWTVLGDFDHGATDEFKNESSDEEAGESNKDSEEESDDDKNSITRRKSVVTFNDNVERIEIERM